MVREVRVRVTGHHKQEKKLVFSVPDRDTRLGGPTRAGASVGYYFFHGGQYYIVGLLCTQNRNNFLEHPHRQCPTVSKVKGLPPVAESDMVSRLV